MKLTFIFYSCFFSKTDNATNKKHPLLGIDTTDDGRQGMLESTYTLLEAINPKIAKSASVTSKRARLWFTTI